VNIKIAGKWMFIPLKMVLIGIDPSPDFIRFISNTGPSQDDPHRTSWSCHDSRLIASKFPQATNRTVMDPCITTSLYSCNSAGYSIESG
jgi:hypothetical protein